MFSNTQSASRLDQHEAQQLAGVEPRTSPFMTKKGHEHISAGVGDPAVPSGSSSTSSNRNSPALAITKVLNHLLLQVVNRQVKLAETAGDTAQAGLNIGLPSTGSIGLGQCSVGRRRFSLRYDYYGIGRRAGVSSLASEEHDATWESSTGIGEAPAGASFPGLPSDPHHCTKRNWRFISRSAGAQVFRHAATLDGYRHR